MVRTALIAALLFGACSSSKHHEPAAHTVAPDEAKQLLINRNWLDKMPATERDEIHVYRFVPAMGGAVFQDRTLFKGIFELFSFEATGTQIRFVLHETHDSKTSDYTISAVAGPKPFDLKLEIKDDPRGPHTYFGQRSESSADSAVLDAGLAALAHAPSE